MEFFELISQGIHWATDFVLNMDQHLNQWVAALGPGIYGILFLIIFCETGVVVMPLLPGDSLLFALGALTAVENPELNLWLLMLTMIPAAILGDAVNYSVGKYLGKRAEAPTWSRWIKPEHLLKTQRFYEKHGGKTIILARFIPIIRTFAPFVAGVAGMNYSRFAMYNVVGAFTWVPSFLVLGHLFGGLPAVKDNFHLVILAIIVLSFLPVLVEWYKSRKDVQAT